jgi:hypothetical protein
MDLSPYQHTERIVVACSPEDAYAVVADVTRIGELSPVCSSGAWEDPATGAVAGAWFTGHNAIGDITWDTRCRVEAAEPGAEFTFVNCGPEGTTELVRWGYAFRPVDGGTEVLESWQILPDYPAFVRGDDADMDVTPRLDGMAAMARDGMAATLAKLKDVVG